MKRKFLFSLVLVLATVFLPAGLYASGDAGIDGAALPVIFCIPFACMLLSIAIFPLVAGNFWHHNYGKVAIFWAFTFIIPFAVVYGPTSAVYEVFHILLTDYIPFIILLFALFTVAGGVRIKGSLVGKPVVNTTILLIGSCLASFMGTTGAAMLFIRPLLRANAHRKYQKHTVIFFIFTVANIGGSLTPLGDPPLFLGFLKGVHFSWTFFHMLKPMILMIVALLIIYYFVDSWLYKKEGSPEPLEKTNEKIGLEGSVNLILLLCVVSAVLMSGTWKPSFGFLNDSGNLAAFESATHIGITLPNLCRDILLLVVAGLSLKITPKGVRESNDFSWEPILEVAKIFIGIFLTMIPALAILSAGKNGALGPIVSLVTSEEGYHVPTMYFFVTGGLSSFLDNAPTYLVFFTLAGGTTDVVTLTTANAGVLLAISCGAVFMGANTYIGNAPNFMVRSIAESQNVKMPSFFGYMIWSVGILMPLFIILTFLFFKVGAIFSYPVIGM